MDGGAESGLLRVRRGLIPADLIAEAVDTLISLVTAAGGPGEGDLDARVTALAAKNRAALSTVYDAMRETTIFRRIVTCEPLAALGSHSPFQHCVFRMDLAGEPWRGFGWHQDYPYNVMSRDYVTCWLPLTDTGAHNGSIDTAPAVSDRIYPVEIRCKPGGRTRDAFIPERFHGAFEANAVKLELAAGDVAVFANTVVHRSGFNPGPRHRYSIQARFGDLLAPEVTARRWANRRADGFDTFKALHPELVEFEETP